MSNTMKNPEPLTLERVLKAELAGGVLQGNHSTNFDSWEEYTKNFDLADPAMVTFLAEWRLFLEAQARFTIAVKTAAKIADVAGFE